MNIRISHIAKMEGHAGFMASVIQGDVRSAKLEVQEGIRLIEGILIGRHFKDVPIVAQRICGICPVVHNLTSIKAIENAMGVKVSPETEKLRAIMELGQIIHSHALHLFFLSLADFLDIENDIQLVKQYPEETKKAIRIREFGMDIVREIGGRVVHPLTNEVGGFKKVPSVDGLQKIIAKVEGTLRDALALGEFFKKIKLPEFSRKTEYVCLGQNGSYPFYDGDIVSSEGLHIPVAKFEANFQELQKQMEVIKKVEHEGKSYMIGAIARVNINHKKLNPKAQAYLESLGLEFPDYNPFHNILAQMAELIHCVTEAEKLLKEFLHLDMDAVISKEFEIKEGVGVAAVEAPRGTLYYHIEVDNRGYVKNLNIITPTAQFLANLEDDIAEYLKIVVNLGGKEREKNYADLSGRMTRVFPAPSISMHDFLLAKEILEEIAKVASEKKLADIKNINLEIGSIALAHDGMPEHTEDIDLENLRFSLESIAPKYGLDKAKFDIKKTAGDDWKITDIEV